MKTAVVVFLVSCGALAHAQQTSTLGHVDPKISYQLSAGGNSPLFGSSYGRQTGTLRALSVGQRRELAGSMELRLDAWAVQRRPLDNGFPYLSSSFDPATGRFYTRRLTSSLLLAAVVSANFPIHLPLDFVFSPLLGLGVAPIASARALEISQNSGGNQESRQVSVTSRGIVIAAGAALRWHHLLIEQHILQVIGADAALYNGENAPLMIGWRF